MTAKSGRRKRVTVDKQFSVTADEMVINRLKTFCNVRQCRIADIFDVAITEYLNRHTRTGDEVTNLLSEIKGLVAGGK